MINYKIDNFKEEIKDILIKNRLVVIKSSTGYYNNNISRKSFWDNNFPEYSDRLFDLYRCECEKLKDCFLYVLKSKQNNFYKIGISLDPILRLRSLKNVIDDFEIIFCVFLKNANTIEKELHNKFKDKKSIISETFDGYSECFDLNNNDIRYIKDYLYENQ